MFKISGYGPVRSDFPIVFLHPWENAQSVTILRHNAMYPMQTLELPNSPFCWTKKNTHLFTHSVNRTNNQSVIFLSVTVPSSLTVFTLPSSQQLNQEHEGHGLLFLPTSDFFQFPFKKLVFLLVSFLHNSLLVLSFLFIHGVDFYE
jgi:hypothetical protein